MKDRELQADELEALPIAAVARLLHVSEPTVRARINSGELRSFLIGRCRRIPRGSISDFIERQSQAEQTEGAVSTENEHRFGSAQPDDEQEMVPF